MASSEKTASRSGLGWMPKLILWIVVIAFGYLYLSSIEREDVQPSPLLESASQLSPAPISASPAASTEEAAASTAPTEAAQPPEKTAQSTDTTPVSDAESTVFAKSLTAQQPASEQAATQNAPEALTEQKTVEATQTPAKLEPDETTAQQDEAMAQPGQAISAQPASDSDTAQSDSANHSASQPQATSGAPQHSEEAQAAQQPQSAQTDAQYDAASQRFTPSDDWAAMQQQHEHMLAYYEALRRAADERMRMREYWARMRPMAPSTPPYGYPVYGSSYGPGVIPHYAPGVYGPMR